MLRIHFTFDDITRVRIARSPDVLWETANSFQTLQRSDGAREFGEWRQWVGTHPAASGPYPALERLLPPRGYSPDFLTPLVGDHSSPEVAVDALLSTPRGRLRADMSRAAQERRLPRWTRDLANGERAALDHLGTAVQDFHDAVVAPVWPLVQRKVDLDRRFRLGMQRDGGVEQLLSGLGPGIRWRSPVLEIDYPVSQELHLNGRGLTLQPSYFCWPSPVSLADPELRPVLVYPVLRGSRVSLSEVGTVRDPLTDIFGNVTRATILRSACGGGCFGSELARRLGITPSAVTQQTMRLRKAGLIDSVPHGQTRYHVATALGQKLVREATRRLLAREPCQADD